MNWYVLFVLGKKEEQIAYRLQQAGIQAFLPKMQVYHKKQGKLYTVEKLMFPNYLFVESKLDQKAFDERARKMKMEHIGIVKELKYDNEGTSALKQEEKEFIEKLIGRNKVLEHSVGYIEGDKVIVTDGPLKGMESKIIHIDRHKRRALLEVMILNQSMQINASLEIVKKI